jgi:alanine-synthesizing transaminase
MVLGDVARVIDMAATVSCGYDARYLKLMEAAHAVDDLIDLTQCDPPVYGFYPEKSVIEEAVQALRQGRVDYGDFKGYPPFIEAVKDRCSQKGGTPSGVLVTHGVSEAFSLISRAHCGRTALIPDPTYIPLYEHFNLTGSVQFYSLIEGDRWSLSEESLRTSITDETQFLVIINPNSPTGAVFREKELKSAVNIAGEYDLTLISDEIYDGVCYLPFTSLLSVCGDVPLLYVNGMSKTHRAPGFRLGYIVLSDPEEKVTALWQRIEHLARIRLSVSYIFQAAAQKALESEDTSYFCRELRKRRDICVEYMEKIEGICMVTPEGTPYGFPRINTDDTLFVWNLLKKGVLVTPGSSYGPSVAPHHFRFTFLHPEPVLETACERIDAVITSSG